MTFSLFRTLFLTKKLDTNISFVLWTKICYIGRMSSEHSQRNASAMSPNILNQRGSAFSPTAFPPLTQSGAVQNVPKQEVQGRKFCSVAVGEEIREKE